MQNDTRNPDAAGPTGGKSARRILVIDDDEDICTTCRIVLEGGGYEVATASSGAEGLAAVKTFAPDLIILDIMMEEPDSGITTARAIGSAIPIILFSNIAGPLSEIFDTSTLPVRDVVNKPLVPQALLEKVGRLLGTPAK